MLFSSEDVLNPDDAVKLQESLPEYFESMSDEEKAALSQIAQETKLRLLAEPDEHGYTQRKLVTDEQRQFLESLASGKLFQQWA